MAICDDDYKFMYCNIGAAGRQSDGGVFRNSELGKEFYANTLPYETNSVDVNYVFKYLIL